MRLVRRRRSPVKPWKHIGVNLLLAFAVVAVTTAVLVVTAWSSLGHLGNQLSSMAGRQLPEAALAARMTKLSSRIRSDAAQMVLVGTRGTLDQAWRDLESELDQLAALNAQSARKVPARHSSMPALLESARESLRGLKDNVRERLVLGERISDQVERLRWLQADYVDEVQPLVADMKFQMNTIAAELSAGPGEAGVKDISAHFNLISSRQSAVMRANAAGNLIIGLLMRAADEASPEELAATGHFLRHTANSLANALVLLRNDASAVSLRQYGQEILKFATGPDDLLSIRGQFLDLARQSSELLGRSRASLDKLDGVLEAQVRDAQQQAEQATRASLDRIGHDRFMLALGMMVVLLISLGTGWLYVGRRVVRRLHRLRTNMLAIAAGNLETRVDTSGDDEISEMADALLLFRDTAAEVEKSNAQLKAEMEERMRAEEELVQTAKLAVLGQVAAEFAHELNQPLSAIAYNVHNAREFIRRQRYEEAGDALDKSAVVAARIGRIVSHLKAFARRPARVLGPVELGACVNAALMLFEEQILSRGVRIRRSGCDGGVRVYAERVLLEQVLVNVIANALDAVAASEAPEVHLIEAEEADRICLSIVDNGPGMDEAVREHLFEPFFTTKDSGRGLGLGLSTSQKIMRDLGGDIAFENAETGGARITLRFRPAGSGALQ